MPCEPLCDSSYGGNELDLFAQARHWKRYWMSVVREYLRGTVLEVGAGLGTNTLLLCGRPVRGWVCLEPDRRLAALLQARIKESPAGPAPEVRCGTVCSLAPDERFDVILYIDVLEHIADDRGELELAASRLAPGGHLLVLAPAHPWLFSPFDQAIGHHRRYTLRTLAALTPPGLVLSRSIYLDSVGLLASALNRLLLRQALPNRAQLWFWDNILVRCSRLFDRVTGHRLGKSAVCVWKQTG